MTTATNTPLNTQSVLDYEAEKKWKTWPDWVNLVLGIVLAFVPAVTAAAPAGWFITLGIVVIAVSLWALATASSPASEWVQIVVGAVVFLAPWIGGFSSASGPAWTAWIVGIAVIVFAAVAMNARPKSA